MLSPQLFNIFINDLSIDLDNSPHKVAIGPNSFNSFAYADDITVMCCTAPGLQYLIDTCSAYAARWKLKFNLSKTHCMVIAGNGLLEEPKWFLNNTLISNADTLESLGVHFSANYKMHIDVRSDKCRRGLLQFTRCEYGFPRKLS